MAKKTQLQSADPWAVINYPNLSEKSINLVEANNTLVFIVNSKSNKKNIKWAVENLFKVNVVDVNVLNDTKNRRKAYVRLSEKDNALDIATRMGMI